MVDSASQERRSTELGLLVLLRGLPGAGKTTYARRRIAGATVVGADRPSLNAATDAEVQDTCFKECLRALEDREPKVVVDACNLTWPVIQPYVLVGRLHGYEVRLITLSASVETCCGRCAPLVPADTLRALAQVMRSARLPAWLAQEEISTEVVPARVSAEPTDTSTSTAPSP